MVVVVNTADDFSLAQLMSCLTPLVVILFLSRTGMLLSITRALKMLPDIGDYLLMP